MSINEDRPNLPILEQYEGLSQERTEWILENTARLKAGVIGDGCLDVYWYADMTLSELSRETPHHTLPVVREIYSPGGAANVAANLKAIGCDKVYFCSVFGHDWRGSILKELFDKLNIDHSYSLTDDRWITPAYCKPIRQGLQDSFQEDPRIDFHNHSPLPEPVVETLVKKLDLMAEAVDVIAVTDQLYNSIVGPCIRERLKYWKNKGKIIVADSRNRIEMFSGLITKPNEIEGLRWSHPEIDPRMGTWDQWIMAATKLSLHTNAPCCMTLGEKGSLWVESGHCIWVPANHVEPPIDIVGAGDCFASALLCALGSGSSGAEAMAFAHLGASIAIRKIGTTGTASPDEIRQFLIESRSDKVNIKSI